MYIIYELMGTTFVKEEETPEQVIEFLNYGNRTKVYNVLEVQDNNKQSVWRNRSLLPAQAACLDVLQNYSPAR